jgi:hypothetical protein
MTSSIATIMALLEEITAHLKSNSASERTAARKKLERIVALSSTLALMLKVKH